MQTRFFWKTSGLLAVMLSVTTAQADDKPAAAKKPTVTSLKVVLQTQRKATAKQPLAALVDAIGTAAKKNSATVQSIRVEAVPGLALDNILVASGPGQAASGRKLGVAVTPADPVLRANVPATKGKLGLVVTSVVKDSPAAKAKIHTGDILLELAARDLATVADLTAAVQKAKSPADARLVRAGKTLVVSVRFPEAANVARSMDELIVYPWAGQSKYTIGVGSKPVDATLASQLVLPPSKGFIIVHVAKGSAAEKAGLQKHDVILTVNDRYVSSAWDLGKALDKAAGKPVKIEFLRAGRRQSCLVAPTKRPQDHYDLMLNNRFYPRIGLARLQLNSMSGLRELGTLQVMNRSTASTLSSQVDRLSKQLDELQKTVDLLKQQFPARKSKVKKPKSK
jgi:serine protease Do